MVKNAPPGATLLRLLRNARDFRCATFGLRPTFALRATLHYAIGSPEVTIARGGTSGRKGGVSEIRGAASDLAFPLSRT